MAAPILLVQLHDKAFAVGDSELVEREDGTLVVLPGHARSVIIGTQGKDNLLLYGRALGDLFIDDFECDEIHVERYVGGILYLRVEIEQAVMSVDAFEEILNAETFTSNMLHFALVLLVWKSHATLTPLAKQDGPLWLQYN